MTRPAGRRALAAIGAAGLLLAACGGGGGDDTASPADATSPSGATTAPAAEEVAYRPAAVQHLDVVGIDYEFEMPPDATTGLAPGWTTVSFRNDGAEAHQIMFARLKDGVDLAELGAAAGGDSSGASAIAYVDMLGGVSYIGPGQTIEAMVDLPEGTVMAMCYVPTADGVAHALLGMTSVLTVTADATPTTAPADPATTDPATTDSQPAGDELVGTIELAADGYRIPDPLPGGWYRVTNTDTGTDGEGLHELSIMRLGRPVADDDLDALLADLATNTAPRVSLEALGGLGAISPGFEGYLHLDLPAGDYLAVDFMPDPGDPRPHLLDGYATTFSP